MGELEKENNRRNDFHGGCGGVSIDEIAFGFREYIYTVNAKYIIVLDADNRNVHQKLR